MRINFFMTFPTQQDLIRRSIFLYVISVHYLLTSLCLAIFLLFHQRKNTLFYYTRTYITYCLLPQGPPHQSLLGESLGEKVAALYYTHYALAEPLNTLN